MNEVIALGIFGGYLVVYLINDIRKGTNNG